MGDEVFVHRLREQPRIHAVSMGKIEPRLDDTRSKQWTPNARLQFDRAMTSGKGKTVQFDVPPTNALESQHTHAAVAHYFIPVVSADPVAHTSPRTSRARAGPGQVRRRLLQAPADACGHRAGQRGNDLMADHFCSAFGIGQNAIRINLLNTRPPTNPSHRTSATSPPRTPSAARKGLLPQCTATGSNVRA
ncbi:MULTISPECIES: hypothetical protein [Amycolatopsis]|uniref:hypothetical protein n=1 Tax=Amycolatopsis TaxID=1813 RepID=UPI00106DF0B2|nr:MULTISPECIES: hypothetical protein [Amycolatopsis]